MKIVITGGCGFVGRHLAERLARDHELVLLDRSPDYEWASSIGAECREFDVVSDEIEGDFDVLIHLAAIISVSESEKNPELVMRVNAEGTKRMIEQAESRNSEFILFSSAAVYGRLDRPAREDDRLNPISAYGRSKAKAEEYALAYGKSLVVRPANIYGPGKRHPGVIEIFLENAKQGKPLIVFGGSQVRDFIYVEDVAEAVARLIGHHGIYNVGTGIPTTINDVVEVIKRAVNRNIMIEKNPMPEYEIPYSVLDISKLSEVYRTSITLEEGIRRMMLK